MAFQLTKMIKFFRIGFTLVALSAAPCFAANNSVTDHTAATGISHGLSDRGGGIDGKIVDAVSGAAAKAVINKGVKEVFGPAVSGAVRALTPSIADAPTIGPHNERSAPKNQPAKR
jgi:hypothetical protein